MGEDVVDYVKRYHLTHYGYNQPFIPENYAQMFGDILSELISGNSGYDAIIARNYYFISNLKVKIPIIYIGDTTFNLFKDYLGVVNSPFALLADKIEQKAIANADCIIYSSEWAKRDAVEHYGANPDKIRVIEFGANLPEDIIPEQISMPKTYCCNLLFIGRNWQNKGGEKAYQTYLSLKRQDFLCSLTIIGCNPAHFDTTDSQLRIIPFLDKSKEEDKKRLREILQNTHFFILPTVFDCYGIVFCEASAYGIPSLSADVGGVHQVIKNGKNGYLFPSDASPDEYARQISETWNNPQKYQELRLSSRQEFNERLNWNVWMQKMNIVLNELILTSKKTTMKTDEETGFYIPTYVINLRERTERKEHIVKEFEGKTEFEVNFVEACTHPIGAVGLWNSIVKIIHQAVQEDHDVILICEDDHYFTEHYSQEYLFENILNAHEQGADILSGGIGGFGYAVPVAKNRYWVDWLWCTQFIVVYKKFFRKILDYEFKDDDTADGVISKLSDNLMTLYPFISRQKEFGYSDITQANKDNPNLITQHFERTDRYLSSIHHISTFYNYPDYFEK